MSQELLFIRPYKDIHIATILPERLTDPLAINRIGEHLIQLNEVNPGLRLVIDLTRVTALSSGFLGKLVALHKVITRDKGRLVVAGVQPTVKPVFQLTQLDKLLMLRKDPDAAIRTLEFKHR